MITKECIICGSAAIVNSETEIATCQNDHCIRTVENSIGLHYAVSSVGIDQAQPGGDFSAITVYNNNRIIKTHYRA